MQHVYHIAFRPLFEKSMVPVLTLGDVPLVERLNHHHESHFIAKFD